MIFLKYSNLASPAIVSGKYVIGVFRNQLVNVTKVIPTINA